MKMKETQEIEVFWRLIANSIERLVECLHGLNADQLNWRPLESANSLYVLATHTMGSAERNILGVFCRESRVTATLSSWLKVTRPSRPRCVGKSCATAYLIAWRACPPRC